VARGSVVGSAEKRGPAERYRRAGFCALFVGGLCGVLSLLAGAAYWSWAPAFQSVLAACTVWCIAAAWYALQRAGYAPVSSPPEPDRPMASRLERISAAPDAGRLFEHLYLKARLEEQQARAARTGGSLSLLYITVEKLDEVGSRFGREVRDRVLDDVANTMSASLRIYDTLGRMGTSEYLAILPNADRRTATRVAERLSRGVERYRRDLPRGGVLDFVRLTVGLAAYPFNGETMDNVVAAARNALAQAQKEGGGTIRASEQFIRTDERGEVVITQTAGGGEG